jgi:hypothetical protein
MIQFNDKKSNIELFKIATKINGLYDLMKTYELETAQMNAKIVDNWNT